MSEGASAPSDLHISGPLEDAVRGRCFVDDDGELKHSLREELRRFSKEFQATGIQRPKQMCKKCVDNCASTDNII